MASDISLPNSHHKCCQKQKLRRGLWSPDEDEKLMNHIRKHGPCSWSSVPELAGLQRCGKSCRLRWINYLRPNLKRGCFTDSEEKRIVELHGILGNKWSRIASYFPGRTDNEIKNLWNSRLRKMLDQKSSSSGAPESESDDQKHESVAMNQIGSACSPLDQTLDSSSKEDRNATEDIDDDHHNIPAVVMKPIIKCADTESSSSQTLSSSSLSSSSSSSSSSSRCSNRNAIAATDLDLHGIGKQHSIQRPNSSIHLSVENKSNDTMTLIKRNPPFNLFPFSLPPDLEQAPPPPPPIPQTLCGGGGGGTNISSVMNNYMNHSSSMIEPMVVAYSAMNGCAKPTMQTPMTKAASYAMNMNGGEEVYGGQLVRSMSEPQMYEEQPGLGMSIWRETDGKRGGGGGIFNNVAAEFEEEEEGGEMRWVCVNAAEWKEMKELWRMMNSKKTTTTTTTNGATEENEEMKFNNNVVVVDAAAAELQVEWQRIMLGEFEAEEEGGSYNNNNNNNNNWGKAMAMELDDDREGRRIRRVQRRIRRRRSCYSNSSSTSIISPEKKKKEVEEQQLQFQFQSQLQHQQQQQQQQEVLQLGLLLDDDDDDDEGDDEGDGVMSFSWFDAAAAADIDPFEQLLLPTTSSS